MSAPSICWLDCSRSVRRAIAALTEQRATWPTWSSTSDGAQEHVESEITETFDLAAPAAVKEEPIRTPRQAAKPAKTPALTFNDLTSPKFQEHVDPVIGRDKEIERLIQILCRRTKNNPVLIGEPGVGKTAIVEGLAKKIIEGDVPEVLLGKRIMALDLGLILAGTIYRGEFEGRLKQIVDEVKNNPDLFLFIDELHTIMGAGATNGSLDANILKPALARAICAVSARPRSNTRNISRATARSNAASSR